MVSYAYDADGALSATAGGRVLAIAYHPYTRLPMRVEGAGGSFSLRYDVFGRRLGKSAAETILYRRGAVGAVRGMGSGMVSGVGGVTGGVGGGIQTLAERIVSSNPAGLREIAYVFTPAGQSVSCELQVASFEKGAYARASRDHLNSLRVEATADAAAWAMYSAYGEALIMENGKLSKLKIENGKWKIMDTGLPACPKQQGEASCELQDEMVEVSGAHFPFSIFHFQFANYELDPETGLYNAWRRLYSPVLRRFVGVDPQLEFASGYLYCGGDPFNRVDPTGGDSFGIVLNAIISAILVLVAIVVTVASSGFLGPEAAVSLEGITALQYGAGVAAIVGDVAIAAGGAELIHKAVVGEHITAWQAVKAMLVQPAIAVATAGIASAGGGALAGLAAEGISQVLFGVAAVTYGMAIGLAGSVASAAVEGTVRSRRAWIQIGVNMAVAAAEAAVAFVIAINTGIPTTAEGAVEPVGAGADPPAVRSEWGYYRNAVNVPDETRELVLMRFDPRDIQALWQRDRIAYGRLVLQEANQYRENAMVARVRKDPSLAAVDEGLLRQAHRVQPHYLENMIERYQGDPVGLQNGINLILRTRSQPS